MTSDHPVVRLGDYVDACLGKMLDVQKNRGQLQPYLGNSNVRWGSFDLENLAVMRFEDHEEERYGIRDGDLIVCEGGEPGRCAIWRGDTPMKIQKALHRVRTTDGLDNYFLYYWFLRAGSTGELEPFFTGTTIKHLTGKALAELRVPLPPIAVQREVAKVLRSLDAKIDVNRRINQTLEAMAQAIFKSWFVDFDPVKAKIAAIQEGRDPLRAAMSAISGKPDAELDALPPEAFAPLAATAALFPDAMEASALGEIPKGWSVARIQDVVEGVYDGPHATPPEATEGAVFLGIRNMTGTTLDMRDIRHIAEADWAQWTRRIEPRAGDIVFSYEATLGYFALLPSGLRCCLGRRLALVRPRTDLGFGSFWFHQFVASPFQRFLEKHTIPGATVNRIALKDFPSFPVLRPTTGVQSAYCARVDLMWSLIHANQSQSERLATLRDTLLPKLLSGELSVSRVNDEVAHAL